jgi:hypothetical protein
MKRIMIVGAVLFLMGLSGIALGMVLAPDHTLKEAEQAYEKELRAARQQIAAARLILDENTRRLHELWEQARTTESAQERAALRPELERLVKKNSELEIKIAELEVKVAEMGLKLAMERLVQARVSLREAQIKLHRRERWLRGDRGDWFRRGPGRPWRGPRTEPTADVPMTEEPAADERPADQPASDEPASNEQDPPTDKPQE